MIVNFKIDIMKARQNQACYNQRRAIASLCVDAWHSRRKPQKMARLSARPRKRRGIERGGAPRTLMRFGSAGAGSRGRRRGPATTRPCFRVKWRPIHRASYQRNGVSSFRGDAFGHQVVAGKRENLSWHGIGAVWRIISEYQSANRNVAHRRRAHRARVNGLRQSGARGHSGRTPGNAENRPGQ